MFANFPRYQFAGNYASFYVPFSEVICQRIYSHCAVAGWLPFLLTKTRSNGRLIC